MLALTAELGDPKILAECISSGKDQHVIAFSHGLAIKFLLAELLNLTRSTAYTDKVNPIQNASITQLCYTNGMLLFPIAKRNQIVYGLSDEMATDKPSL